MMDEIKLPNSDNALLIRWEDNFQNLQIDMTPYLWDIFKCLEDSDLVITHKEGGYKLSITIDMIKEGVEK